jgi:glycosyltransferase involved in cell wall biosynthesis
MTPPWPRSPEVDVKILYIRSQILFPHDTGGKIRALNILKHLACWHDVTYLCNVRPAEEPYCPEMRAIGVRLEGMPKVASAPRSVRYYGHVAANLLSPYPFTVARNYDPALRARARALARDEDFDLLICDSVQMARHMLGVRGPARVLFQRNVEAQLLRRHAETDAGLLRSRYMAIQWRKMRRFEAACGAWFDATIAVSEPDRRTFAEVYGWSNVHAIDTAVDVDYFRPAGRAEAEDRVLFLGSMDWLPNQDCVAHFVRDIWPSIRRARPGATFHVVGRNPPPEIERLSGKDGIVVTGTVPDVRPHLEEAAVVVIPLRVGGGTRLKIFEAMAMGKAVVSTTIGAEGLPVTPGEHIILADDPAAFAAAVTGLLAAPERRAGLGTAALHLVTERFGTETVARQFDSICRNTVQRSGGRSELLSAGAQ